MEWSCYTLEKFVQKRYWRIH